MVYQSPVSKSILQDNQEYPFEIQQTDTDIFIFSDKGQTAHKSKVFRGSRILRSFGYKSDMICIGDCETPEAYRGQGLYPKMLRYLYTKFGKEFEVYILVTPWNKSSIKGIEKSGAQRKAKIECLKIGPLYLNKRIQRYD